MQLWPLLQEMLSLQSPQQCHPHQQHLWHPTAPLATTLPTTTKLTSTTGASGEKETKLVKAMEDMSIRAIEMNRLREKVASLETQYKLSQLKQKEEAQKAQRMSERIKILEKDLTLEKPLRQTKEMLWANIIDSIKDIWP